MTERPPPTFIITGTRRAAVYKARELGLDPGDPRAVIIIQDPDRVRGIDFGRAPVIKTHDAVLLGRRALDEIEFRIETTRDHGPWKDWKDPTT